MRIPSVCLCLLAALALRAADKNILPESADDAWKEVEQAGKPPAYPEEWGGKQPSAEQREQFQKLLGARSAEAAGKAREFYTRFPEHAKAAAAKENERRFVEQAITFGATNLSAAVESSIPEEQRIQMKLNAANRRAMQKQPEGLAAVMKDLEAAVRDIMKQHPKSPAVWGHLMLVVHNTPDKEHAKALLDEVIASHNADDDTKAQAKGMLRVMGAVGRPLELSFTATDGSAVNIQKMKGQVVLIDYWASWCGPCIASLPDVIELYETYHDKGLEIVGINMDKGRPAMDGAIEKFQIPWRQYYDGRGWGNRFALEYNVGAIPAMWLVDKKGILRTMEARENLEGKVKDLLAEPWEP